MEIRNALVCWNGKIMRSYIILACKGWGIWNEPRRETMGMNHGIFSEEACTLNRERIMGFFGNS
jgi:hypothetical protein